MTAAIRKSAGPECPRPAQGSEPSVALKNGTLTINGTAGKDHISVVKDANNNLVVKSGGEVLGSFPADQVQDVHVRGHQGRDKIKVDVGEGVGVRVRGGHGKDAIKVKDSDDAFVRGGRGDDRIALQNVTGARVFGNRGDDVVADTGAPDDNTIDTGAGDDEQIFGAAALPAFRMSGVLGLPRKA